MLNKFIYLNGIYDIFCSILLILYDNYSPHLLVYKDKNKITKYKKNYLSLFIFSYGSIRVFSNEKILLKYSYISEMLYYIFELILNDNINKINCSFIVITCFIIQKMI
jgi:hypothetical protein